MEAGDFDDDANVKSCDKKLKGNFQKLTIISTDARNRKFT